MLFNILVIIAIVSAFKSYAFTHQPFSKSFQKVVKHHDFSHDRAALRMIVADHEDRPVITIGEYFTPPQIDRTNLMVTLIGQSVLTAFAFLGGSLVNTVSGYNLIDILNNPNFDYETMKFAFVFGSGMLALGLAADRLPVEYLQTIYRDTKIFTLRLLGRNSNPLPAAATAFLVSTSASISEELFFRGFVYQLMASIFDPFSGLIISSSLFGLAHFPILGANALMEAILGGIFGFAYMYSGNNIACPIAIHGLYDFGTIFITWLIASKDLRHRILLAKEFEFSSMAEKDPFQINAISRMVFQYIDVGHKGFVDENDFIQGLQLFGTKSGTFSDQIKYAKDTFKNMDTNNDGKVDFYEFSSLMKDEKGRPSWLFKAAAMSDQADDDHDATQSGV